MFYDFGFFFLLFIFIRFYRNASFFILFVVPSGIVGARLYFVAFKLENYIIRTGNFWKDLGDSLYKIIAAWEGGLAIYGAVIAGGIAAVLVARHKKIKLLI